MDIELTLFIALENSIKGYELRLENRNSELKELNDKCNELHLDIEAKRRRVQILTELEKKGFSFLEVSDLIYKDNYIIDHTGMQIPR